MAEQLQLDDQVAERSHRQHGTPGSEQIAGLAESTLGFVTAEASRILDAALNLPESERAEIAAILVDSIGDGSAPEEVMASWVAEAKRRLMAVQRGESTPVPLDEMMRRLRSKVRRGREPQPSGV